MAIPGTVTVTGIIAPTVVGDDYPVTDAKYGLDGLRNVATKEERNEITALRRRAGMIVGTSGETRTEYWSLKPEPWAFTDDDWMILSTGQDVFVTGMTFDTSNYNLKLGRNGGLAELTQSLSILASDLRVTGGTYNNSNGTATFTNNSGGTFNVTGFLVGYTDIYVTGGTISNETLTLRRNDGNDVTIPGFVDANIYTKNGTLTGNRVVSTTSGYTLTINPQTTFSPNIPAPTGTTIGTLFSPIISATTTGTSTFVGVDISPTYTGSTSNKTYIDLRTRGVNTVFGSGVGYGALYGSGNDGVFQISNPSGALTRYTLRASSNPGGFHSMWWSWMEQDGYTFRIYSGPYVNGQMSGQWFVGGPYNNGSASAGALFAGSGNVIFGSLTDSGHKIDSYGVTRIRNNFGVGTYSTPSQPSLTAVTTGGTITAETTGTVYTYSIAAVDNLGYTTPASVTRSVTISGGTENSVIVTWASIPGISQYRIYRTNPLISSSSFRYYVVNTNLLNTSSTFSFTDTDGGTPQSVASLTFCNNNGGCNPPVLNQTLRTNTSSSGDLFVNGTGTFTSSGNTISLPSSRSRIFFGNRELAIGDGSVSAYEGIAIGFVSSAETQGIAIGKWAKAPGGAIVIGNSQGDIGDIKGGAIRIGASNLSGIGIGAGATTGGDVNSTEIAIGSATATGAGIEGNIAIGRFASANGAWAIALGAFSKAEGGEFVAGAAGMGGADPKPITNVYFGSGKIPLPFTGNAVSYTINGSGANGINLNGGNITIAGGKGTGSGNPGNIIFSTSIPLSSGSTLQSLTERMRISSSGNTLIGTTTDVPSAILNVASTTQGFLPPRMTGAQVEAIVSPAEGLMVYATSASLGGIITSKGWWGYNGLSWVKILTA